MRHKKRKGLVCSLLFRIPMSYYHFVQRALPVPRRNCDNNTATTTTFSFRLTIGAGMNRIIGGTNSNNGLPEQQDNDGYNTQLMCSTHRYRVPNDDKRDIRHGTQVMFHPELCRPEQHSIECNSIMVREAAMSGDALRLTAIIEQQPSADYRACIINSLDKGYTALSRASERGHVEVVRILLLYGAEMETKNRLGATALVLAAQCGYAKVVRELVAAGADVEAVSATEPMETPLTAAIARGHAEAVQVLLDAGAQLENSIGFDGHPLPLLSLAIRKRGNPSIVQSLIDAGAPLEERGRDDLTPLMYGAIFDAPGDTVGVLVNAGADLEAVDSYAGNTPLFKACWGGALGVAKVLISAGHPRLIDQPNNEGTTPLMIAAANGHHEVVTLLMGAGAQLDTKKDNEDDPRMAVEHAKDMKSCARLYFGMACQGTPPPLGQAALSRWLRFSRSGTPLRWAKTGMFPDGVCPEIMMRGAERGNLRVMKAWVRDQVHTSKFFQQ